MGSPGPFTPREFNPKPIQMSWRDRLLDIISNPTIAYILLMLGIYGIFFELSSPGAILPGVVGGIFLILAFYALQMLPVNYAGLALILFAIILFIAEIKVVSHGLLAVGGVISLFLGSMMLFQSPVEYMRVSMSVIIPAVLVSAAFFIFAVTKAIKARLQKPTTGMEGLVGETGIAATTHLSRRESLHSWRVLECHQRPKYREGGKGSSHWSNQFKTESEKNRIRRE